MSNILQINNLSKRYGSTLALDDVSFTLPAGNIIGLLGPNGSGKTTLIKILNTLITDYKGHVNICGFEPGIDTKKIVSYLPDTTYLSPWMTVHTCIDLFNDFYTDFDKTKATNMAQDLELPLNMRVAQLSKGMSEKLQLLLVMCRNASLYLFDEPLAAVDPAARDFIINTILTNYNENGSVVISTHLVADIEQVLDYALFLQRGKIVLDEPVDVLRNRTGQTLDQHFREVFRYHS